MRPDYWNLKVESVLEVKEKGYNGNESFIENRTVIPNKAIAMVTQAPGSWKHSVSKHLGHDLLCQFLFQVRQE